MVPAEAFYEWVGPQGAQAATEHWTSRRKVTVVGGTVQLLETQGLGRISDRYFHRHYDGTESMDDTHSQPHARHIAGRSDFLFQSFSLRTVACSIDERRPRNSDLRIENGIVNSLTSNPSLDQQARRFRAWIEIQTGGRHAQESSPLVE